MRRLGVELTSLVDLMDYKWKIKNKHQLRLAEGGELKHVDNSISMLSLTKEFFMLPHAKLMNLIVNKRFFSAVFEFGLLEEEDLKKVKKF